MYFSKLFAPTTKDTPNNAVVSSHIFLTRGGFIQQVNAGIYNFLPLGLRVLQKVENIIRYELNKVNAQESKLGFVTPISLWQESGRANKYGSELLKFTDRKNNQFVLGPTHEEMMVNVIRDRVKSYKQLPLNIYQIHTKFRDEARARFGILRAREFIMKDGYSFHSDDEDMKREFSLMRDTYSKIFDKIGLNYAIVDADSGAIGGSGSQEFMVLADSGEDDIIVCSKCNYSANMEAGERELKTYEEEIDGDFSYFLTKDITKIEDISNFFHIQKDFIIKAVVKKAIYEENEELVIFFLRGSDELQEIKATNACGALELLDANDEDLENAGLKGGFIGPITLEDTKFASKDELENRTEDTLYKSTKTLNIKSYFDISLQNSKQKFICGANKKDFHFVGFDINTLKNIEFTNLSCIDKDDKCIKCGNNLSIKKGIEVGHIFQLGTKYTDALKATFLDKNGKAQNFVMGTYGIGVSRILSACIEQSHDEKGCIWPLSIAPFEVVIIISNIKDELSLNKSKELYNQLKEKDIDVLLDDRADRFGAKMSDFELIGIPYAIIVGKGIAEDKIEIVNRKTLIKQETPYIDAINTIQKELNK
jgi:prolyl-tRNA synthetase